VYWNKPQEVPPTVPSSETEVISDPARFTITMTALATPDLKQSEAFVATSALFYIFSHNARDEKVGHRLPPVWRDLWAELLEAKKSRADSEDRAVVKVLRDIVRQRCDQELEDGVILQKAFRGRNNGKNTSEASETGLSDRSKSNASNGDVYKKIWADKSGTHKYQTMLVSSNSQLQQNVTTGLTRAQQSRIQLPMWHFRKEVLDTVDKNQVVIVCGETGW
jgi:ATP-dependent RNA helicase DHX29